MMTESEALAAILAAVPASSGEDCPLSEAWCRVAAQDVFAAVPLPGFDNSAMDGWAIHESDCGRLGVRLRITGEQPAGADRGLTVGAGCAVRVFTGAPLPAGCGAVVMQEDARREGDMVVIEAAADTGEFMRRRGCDVCTGQLIVRAGEILTPARIGILASQGKASVHCNRLPAVSILCTGEELTAPGEPLPHAGALYNSNGPMLAALFHSSRLAAAVFTGTAPDRLEILTARLQAALESSDVLVIAGGVSVGDHDLVKPALQSLGISPQFWRVSIRPGKPFLFCTAGRKLIFGVPGNPVSAFVTSVLFVLPALRRLNGMTDAGPFLESATLAAPLHNPGDRRHYLRGVFDPGTGTFRPSGMQESHALGGLCLANALARLEPGTQLGAGETVPVLRLS